MTERVLRATLLTLLVIAGSAPPLAAQSQALAFSVYPSPAPNRHGSGVSLTAWESWVGRALDSVENNRGDLGDLGSDPAAFTVVRNVKPREFIVTSNPSWRAQADPQGAFAGQQGNRLHFVLHLRGDGRVRFKFEDISWDWWSNGGWFTAKRSMAASPPPGYSAAFNRVDCTYGYGYDWGADRAKGGGDDTKVCDSDTTLVDELFYVGAGLGMAADNRYNKPDEYPDDAHLTLQEWLFLFCDYFNSEADTRQVGMLFRVVGSDNATYEHTAKLINPEFGEDLNPSTCRPFPAPRASRVEKPAPQVKAPVYTGEALQAQGFQLSATHGLRSGVQFQRRDARAIGIQSVLDAGFIDAVDVWGYAEQTVEVCFPLGVGPGALLFLDATTSPRAVSALPAVLRSGAICTTIHGPGTIVLVESWPGAPLPTQHSLDFTTLQDCAVTTAALLNFRDAPAGNRITDFPDYRGARDDWIPPDATLTALAWTPDWFKVDYHGTQGWISADWVRTQGDCGG